MEIEKLNNLFKSDQMISLQIQIAKENDFRLCLNRDVISEYRNFFGTLILFSFVLEIEPNELKDIYKDKEKYLATKLSRHLNINDIYSNKNKVLDYFNAVLGKKEIIFHGTTSLFENNTTKDLLKNSLPLNECRIIDKIYRNHKIYKAFENGIKDYEENNFWTSPSPSSACFYSLQSPEYFARFSSRSDYYKQDPFKYDRIAYYRKDYKACRKNILIEMKEFAFSREEKNIVLNNFKTMWKKIVLKNAENIIYCNEISKTNIQKIVGNETLLQILLKFFPKVHFKLNINLFKENAKKIILPKISKYLKRHFPILNIKYLIVDGKKIVPDFYIIDHYSDKNTYFSFKYDNYLLKKIDPVPQRNKYSDLILITNECSTNTKQAKNFLKNECTPKVFHIIEFYKKQFKQKFNLLRSAKTLSKKLELIKDICHNCGLKYAVCKKYNEYFKNINKNYIYRFRQYLGGKLFEHYDGIPEIKEEKLKKLYDIYKKVIYDEKFLIETDIPLKIDIGEIEIIK